VKLLRTLLLIISCCCLVDAQKLPRLQVKPPPKFESRSFCPAIGLTSSAHNDPELNKAKNRVDDSNRYFTVSFDEIKNLELPAGIGRRKRSSWTQEARDVVAQFEGIPIQLTGFLALTERRDKFFGAIAEGAELCNCQSKEPNQIDYHLWLVARVGDLKAKSVVVEMTPRVRSAHPGWTIDNLNTIGIRRLPVRVSGWLLIDQEHPEQIGKHRANLWEIHPVMIFEYKEGGRWKVL
jgi:hypothetical protein